MSATFALIKSHFPDYTESQLLVRAVNNVHNGTGKFGDRIDDKLGYGEILPYFAMTFDLGPNPPNPIFDAWAEGARPAGVRARRPRRRAPHPPEFHATPAPTTSAPAGPTNGGITVAGESADSGVVGRADRRHRRGRARRRGCRRASS